MDIKQKPINATGIKLYIEQDGKEVARAFLYILKNDLHQEPFGFIEDVFVDENCRCQGLATGLLAKLIEVAKENQCYKIVCTCRHEKEKVHRLYEKVGFKNFGVEFKLYL
jgi:ribosomal protein S18 acetylase RimI-like enzyme